MRPLQAEFRAHAGPLLVEGGDADPATLGAAFDYLVRFSLDHDYMPAPATAGFLGEPALLEVVLGVVRTARDAGPGSAERLRAMWALALCTEVYRRGLVPDSPLVAVLEDRAFTVDALLALAPMDPMRQLAALYEIADERLRPALRDTRHLALGPTFDGSALCAADADVIADGLLLEIKTTLGSKNERTGARADVLPLTSIYQLVAYALFDTSDMHRIDRIGVYSARYGHLAHWPLDEALTTMAGGHAVDLSQARTTVWRLLGGA